ncbi:hypothetical protein [Sphingobacterium faecium]|uniref:hypothetical protein n=1 Tax=Sphingobacterium faecium TaxID=34087 RepID=UPI0032098D14
MKHQFTLPDFPDSNFQIEVSFWTGKQTLYKDEVLVERSSEKGKPFLVPDHNGDIVKAYPKATFPDIIPVLEINNLKYNIVEKLKWYQAVLAVMPFTLAFIGGGALGGGIGAVAALLNLQVLRNEKLGKISYLYVVNITIAAYAAYFFLALMIREAIN